MPVQFPAFSARPVSARRGLSRRELLQAAMAGTLSLGGLRTLSARGADAVSGKWLTIEQIDRTVVEVPYRETPARAMARELPHWKYSEICEIRLKSGKSGVGETMIYYSWGKTEDDDVARALGQNAAELMWDDTLGPGLQIALFDAVARTFDVPVYSLLGTRLVDRTPLSWWNIDTPPEDMASECAEALRQGYMSYKTKGRPWFDLWKQMELSTKVVPENFKIDMDFNDTLLDAERAIPILLELERYPQIDIWEGPIPQADIAGNRKICEAVRGNVAQHYGNPDPFQVLRNDATDGFVVGGGATKLMQTGAVCEMAEKPFWLQLTGTGITAAWSLHFGAVLKNATWPAVNCHQLYQHTLLTAPMTVANGTAAIPTTPGLGYELDRAAVAKYRVARPASRPEPERLLETTWPDGRVMYVASNGTVNFILNLGMAGKIPYFEKGVDTRLLPDDGSAKWRKLYQQAQSGPVLVK